MKGCWVVLLLFGFVWTIWGPLGMLLLLVVMTFVGFVLTAIYPDD